MRSKINKIVEIADDTINNPYVIGENDCNILVLRVIDLLCDTNYTEKATGYTSIKEGLKIFKDNGFKDLEELVQKYCTEVEIPILGDIYIDGIMASVFLHETYIEVNHERHVFQNVHTPKELKGKIYRINREG